jgi:hypothetical protein
VENGWPESKARARDEIDNSYTKYRRIQARMRRLSQHLGLDPN